MISIESSSLPISAGASSKSLLSSDAMSSTVKASSPSPAASSASFIKTKSSTSRKDAKPWTFVIFFLLFFHLVSLLTIFFYPLTWQNAALILGTWIFGGLGITAGYHRLWSHRAFHAVAPVRLVLAIAGAAAYQGSIKWWVLRHRLHHRYTDTEHDPYDATKGFFYSHMGWMFEKPEYTRLKWIDKQDLDADPIVQWQHRNYPAISLVVGLVVPTLLGSLWGDALGGFLYGGYVSRIVIWHSTWFINSLAHAWGDQEFSHENTSRGNLILALLTFGEGFHNFHHQFPRDFRNGIRSQDWDPTKWLIAGLSYLGLTFDLKIVPEDVILKAKITTAHEKIEMMNKNLIWSDVEKLPLWSMAEFEEEALKSQSLILIDGLAVDISLFKLEHPGGESLIVKYIGKDATNSFYGSLNNHTKSARQIMKDLAVAQVSSTAGKKEQ